MPKQVTLQELTPVPGMPRLPPPPPSSPTPKLEALLMVIRWL